jgi:hypothetical protein
MASRLACTQLDVVESEVRQALDISARAHFWKLRGLFEKRYDGRLPRERQ